MIYDEATKVNVSSVIGWTQRMGEHLDNSGHLLLYARRVLAVFDFEAMLLCLRRDC